MLEDAEGGDIKAAQLILDRFRDPVSKEPLLQLQQSFDSRQLNLGTSPPVPSTRELGEYLAKLSELSDDLPTVEIIERDEAQDLEDLLS